MTSYDRRAFFLIIILILLQADEHSACFSYELTQCSIFVLYPLSPKSDQHQIPPCNINTLENTEVMRIKDMITQDEFSPLLL